MTDAFPQLQTTLRPSTLLARINYHLGQSSDLSTSPAEAAVYPVPIHEVTTALDYLASSTSPFNHDQDEPPKICLLGSHIGGALATMLALTEPNSIHALAAIEPVVDWVGLDELVEQLHTAESSRSKTSAQKQTQRQTQKIKNTSRFGIAEHSVLAAAEALIKLRGKLFKTPSAYFDPFASPMLFLRAPGRDTPLNATVGDQMMEQMGLNQGEDDSARDDPDAFGPYDDDWQSSSATTPTTTSSTETSNSEAHSCDGTATSIALQPPRRRKVLRRWPAVGNPEEFTLPHVRIFLQSESNPMSPATDSASNIPDLIEGHAALMRAQGKEMTELMRRACFIGREKSFAEERVQLRLCETEDGDGKDRAGEMQVRAVEWVEEMFA